MTGGAGAAWLEARRPERVAGGGYAHEQGTSHGVTEGTAAPASTRTASPHPRAGRSVRLTRHVRAGAGGVQLAVARTARAEQAGGGARHFLPYLPRSVPWTYLLLESWRQSVFQHSNFKHVVTRKYHICLTILTFYPSSKTSGHLDLGGVEEREGEFLIVLTCVSKLVTNRLTFSAHKKVTRKSPAFWSNCFNWDG